MEMVEREKRKEGGGEGRNGGVFPIIVRRFQ